MTSISLSTREAARLFRVEPHVLYSNYTRHGGYLGIVPRKGKGRRLYWPAQEVRELVLPPETEWPAGMSRLLEVMQTARPEADVLVLYDLGLVLLGSEYTPGWKPAPGQTPETILTREPGLVAMMVQSLKERADWAMTQVQQPGASRVLEGAADFITKTIRPFTTDVEGGRSEL